MEFSNRDHVAGVSPLYENVCRFLSEHGSVPPADSSDADPEEVYPSISGNSGVESGLIFLGSGGSASIPQLNHVLAFSDAHHPFYRFARGEAVLPALPVMQQQAIEYRQRLKRLQVEAASKQPTALCASSDPAVSGCNGVSTNAATGEHETPTLNASDLRDLELKAMDARNAACPTCLKAFLYPNNRNGRRNISLLLSVEKKRLLIDCGKTLRDSVISFCCPFQISSVDAVFLTHDHMDAVGGLDDLRDMQPFDRLTLRSLSAGEALGSRDERAVTRCLRVGLSAGVRTPIFSFPVYHGGSYVCLGLMSLGAEPFLLLSDVTAVPAVVLQRLLELPRPEVMVVDAIGERPHAAHFSLQEALDLGVLLQPRRLLFVGMDCCLEHNLTNRRLQVWLTQHREMYRAVNGRESRIQEVRLAHDGLFLAFNTGAA
ncbi:putative hydrolase-like protein [Cyclospora cayetanensis]|uniref:Hydrolase-like protein n=1 Tax=Cyclospora cayetanensis TaxID=88456 RepID=A0A1D3D8U3_9EIME|nr:putative hydrolase-like protein [Cyclospora cayetanensis]